MICAVRLLRVVVCAALLLGMPHVSPGEPASPDSGEPQGAEEAAVRASSLELVAAYNKGDADALAALFCSNAELVDDAGNVFSGRDDIQAIYVKFLESFPEAQMDLDIESVRFVAPGVAIEDGTRTVVTGEGTNVATNRYTMVFVLQDGQWLIASARELAEDPQPTAGERLEPLAWLVGNWLDESNELDIVISCRWDESGNFLLLDFEARGLAEDQSAKTSHQRIGWDPLTGRVRSWIFDADGGYGQGDWTQLEDRWVIKSTAVLPDGTTGSATIAIQPAGPNRFVMSGFDRILGNAVEHDFQALIVRKPPRPAR